MFIKIMQRDAAEQNNRNDLPLSRACFLRHRRLCILGKVLLNQPSVGIDGFIVHESKRCQKTL